MTEKECKLLHQLLRAEEKTKLFDDPLELKEFIINGKTYLYDHNVPGKLKIKAFKIIKTIEGRD